MNTEELYREVPCRRCGKMKLKSSSFCPHCGYVQEESWLDRLRNRLAGGGTQAGGSRNVLVVAIASAVLVGAAFLAYDAVVDGRYEDLVTIAVIVLLSIRAFYRIRTRSGMPGGTSGDEPAESAVSPTEGVPAPQYTCENCGTRVDAGATECPRCGTRFA